MSKRILVVVDDQENSQAIISVPLVQNSRQVTSDGSEVWVINYRPL
jgi:hypothetical protein